MQEWKEGGGEKTRHPQPFRFNKIWINKSDFHIFFNLFFFLLRKFSSAPYI